MQIPILDNATEFGLSAIRLYRRDGELHFEQDHPALTPTEQEKFPALVMRAMDSLPLGATGDRIISRILAQVAVDKRFSDLGQIGKGVPTQDSGRAAQMKTKRNVAILALLVIGGAYMLGRSPDRDINAPEPNASEVRILILHPQ